MAALLVGVVPVQAQEDPAVSPYNGVAPNVFVPDGYWQRTWYWCLYPVDSERYNSTVVWPGSEGRCYALPFEWVDSGRGGFDYYMSVQFSAGVSAVGESPETGLPGRSDAVIGILPPRFVQTATVECDFEATSIGTGTGVSVTPRKSAWILGTGLQSINAYKETVGLSVHMEFGSPGASAYFDSWADDIGTYIGGETLPETVLPIAVDLTAQAVSAGTEASASAVCRITGVVPWETMLGEYDEWMPDPPGFVPGIVEWVPINVTPIASVPQTVTFGFDDVEEPPTCVTLLPAWSGTPFSVTVAGVAFGSDGWDAYGVCLERKSLAFEFLGINWGLLLVALFGVMGGGVLFRILKAA